MEEEGVDGDGVADGHDIRARAELVHLLVLCHFAVRPFCRLVTTASATRE